MTYDPGRWRPEFPILGTTTYMISNSLGAMPRGTAANLARYAETWATRGVRAACLGVVVDIDSGEINQEHTYLSVDQMNAAVERMIDVALAAGVVGDDTLLAVLVRNLVDNAIKFSPPGETVRVTARHTEDGGVEIAVIDGTRRLGNGRLLPAGPLREPPARLAEVDAVVRLVMLSKMVIFCQIFRDRPDVRFSTSSTALSSTGS